MPTIIMKYLFAISLTLITSIITAMLGVPTFIAGFLSATAYFESLRLLNLKFK